MDDLSIEGPVREVRPDNEGCVGDVGGGGVSQGPLVPVDHLRPVLERVVGDEEPLLPPGAVGGGLEGVSENLGFEEGSGSWAVEKSEWFIARAVLVHCRLIVGRDGLG